jgi:enolase-phosphatase E1
VCPISFVRDVLFPYCLAALSPTLASQWDAPAFAPYRDAFPAEHRASPAALEAHVRDLVARDVKAPYLKVLQGLLWQDGYASGRIRAPLFADVPRAVAAWKAAGLAVAIYSSGSVAAQKLFFGHTDAGGEGEDGLGPDFVPAIAAWFDTVNAGPKTERASYAAIMAAPDAPRAPAAQWLFLSDNPLEVRAARAAGMQSVVVVRPGNAPLGEEHADVATGGVLESFDRLHEVGA